MRKTKITILSFLFIIALTGNALSKDLTPEQLQGMLTKVEQQKFDARDTQNKKVESKDIQTKVSGIFRLVERLQNLKAWIGTPTAFGSVLVRNNLALNNSPSERSNLYAPLDYIGIPEIVWMLLRDKKNFMFSSLPAHVSPAGLSVVLVSFLIVTLWNLTTLNEPRFRFQVKIE